MTRRLLIAALAIGLAAPAGAAASGVELVGPDGAPAPWPYSAWGHALKVGPTSPVVVELTDEAPCGEERATGCNKLTNPPRVVVRRSVCPASPLCRVTITHEIGHIDDELYMGDAAHRAFARIFGRTLPIDNAWSWWWTEAGQDGGLPEWFAEGYRLCARNPRRPALRDYVAYGYHPTRRQHVAVCGLVRTVARRHS